MASTQSPATRLVKFVHALQGQEGCPDLKTKSPAFIRALHYYRFEKYDKNLEMKQAIVRAEKDAWGFAPFYSESSPGVYPDLDGVSPKDKDYLQKLHTDPSVLKECKDGASILQIFVRIHERRDERKKRIANIRSHLERDFAEPQPLELQHDCFLIALEKTVSKTSGQLSELSWKNVMHDLLPDKPYGYIE